MNIVVVNPVLYTSEKSPVRKVESIKDTMIYNLCLAIKKLGHKPILIAAEDFRPIKNEEYDFEIYFLDTIFDKIFKPNCFPLLKGLNKILKKIEFDFVIASEVFSMSSLLLSIKYKKRLIVWHELAKHNNIFNKIPSKIWYNIICKIFFKNTRIVARSKNAQNFISNYCNNVSNSIIDHGVDLDKFEYSKQKNDQFIVVSRLSKKKKIDGIIKAFSEYSIDNDSKLYIIGSGQEKDSLQDLAIKLNMKDKIFFKGQLDHTNIIPLLAKSKALVINTEKDNNMISIVESIACGTPLISTPVPYNTSYIIENNLGVITDSVNVEAFKEIDKNLDIYVSNCNKYREKISNLYHVKQFIIEYKNLN